MPRASKPTLAGAASLAASVTPMAEIVSMSVKDRCSRFAERATVSQRAFAEMGKLHHAISADLKKGQTIYGELRKLGVKDSTISNASYASRVWGDLIAPGHLSEAQFDSFTFADCLAICRATGAKSKRVLTTEDVVLLVNAGGDFEVELNSIYETGLTVAEAEAQAAAEAARKADAKAAEERAVQAKLEQEKQAAVVAALAAQAAKETQAIEGAKGTGAAETPATTPADATGSKAPAAPAVAAAPAVPVPTAPAAPAAETAAPAAMPAPAPETAPANVTTMPVPEPTAEEREAEIIAGLDALAASTAGLPVESLQRIFAKVNEVLGFVGEQIAELSAKAA